jgi:hypothetical protein
MRVFVIRGGALAVAALIAAGCGSNSSGSGTTAEQSTFRSDFGLVTNQFKQTSHGIGLAIEHASSQSDAQLTSTFSALAVQWQDDLSKLKGLTPPPSVVGPYQTLSGAAIRTEADLNAIVAAAKAHDGAAAKQASEHLLRDILQAKSAARAIDTKLGIT